MGLDAQMFGRGDALEAVQDRWLDRVLTDVLGPVGLFLHRPRFRDDPADPDPHHRYVPMAPRTVLREWPDKATRDAVCPKSWRTQELSPSSPIYHSTASA